MPPSTPFPPAPPNTLSVLEHSFLTKWDSPQSLDNVCHKNTSFSLKITSVILIIWTQCPLPMYSPSAPRLCIAFHWNVNMFWLAFLNETHWFRCHLSYFLSISQIFSLWQFFAGWQNITLSDFWPKKNKWKSEVFNCCFSIPKAKCQ